LCFCSHQIPQVDLLATRGTVSSLKLFFSCQGINYINTLPLILSYMLFGMTNYTVVVTEGEKNTSGQIIVHMRIATCLTFLSNNASTHRWFISLHCTLAVYYLG